MANAKQKTRAWLPWVIVIGVILLIVGCAFLVYFLKTYHHVVKFGYDDANKLVDLEEKVTYEKATSVYKARLLITDPQYGKAGDLPIYKIAYRSKDGKIHSYKAEYYVSTGIDDGSELYFNPEKVKLPAHAEFLPDSSYICSTDGVVFAAHKLGEDETLSIVLAILNESGKNPVTGAKDVFEIRLLSEKYPELYYCLKLYVTDHGYYVQDPGSGIVIREETGIFNEMFAQEKTDE